ncbi:hypothetical protein ACFLV2_00525 [Chloroflexota bacterium]
MYDREQLRQEFEKCLKANSDVMARIKQLENLNQEFKSGKRDTFPPASDWTMLFQERDIINARIMDIKKIALDSVQQPA